MAELDADVGLVGRLVGREAEVAEDAHQRAADLRVASGDRRRDLLQHRAHGADQLEGGLAQLGLVAFAILLEPVASIVQLELGQKVEDSGLEARGGRGHAALQTPVACQRERSAQTSGAR